MYYFSAFSLLLFFLTYCVWGLLFPGFLFEFFLPFGFCLLVSVWPSDLCKLQTGRDLCWILFALLFLWWARLSEVTTLSADDWACIFVVFCLVEASCKVWSWWLGDARPCIQVIFVWVLAIWYSLGLFLWQSRVLESVIPLQRLRAWFLVKNDHSTVFCCGVTWD